MHQGQLVFAQLMRHLPLTTFRRCVARYAGEHKVKSFSCVGSGIVHVLLYRFRFVFLVEWWDGLGTECLVPG
jgi:Domain of unknown function (DUF4372)